MRKDQEDSNCPVIKQNSDDDGTLSERRALKDRDKGMLGFKFVLCFMQSPSPGAKAFL